MLKVTHPNPSFERAFRAVEQVRERLERATAALGAAGVPYAVIGGNAVNAWVTTADPEATRNTKDVDILLRRADLAAAKVALESAGFIYRHAAGIDFFLDGPEGSFRSGVHVIFANEPVKPDSSFAAPDVSSARDLGEGRSIVELDALVLMKLTAYRRLDQVHILDLIGVGLIDETWLDRVPPELRERLKELLDSPEVPRSDP